MSESGEKGQRGVVNEKFLYTPLGTVMTVALFVLLVCFLVFELPPVLEGFWAGLGVAYLLCRFLPKRWSRE